MEQPDPFSKQLNETYVSKEINEIKSVADNRLPLRRIWIMPTLIVIRPFEIDHTSPIIREVKNFKEYLAKINILSDMKGEEFFNSKKTEDLL